MSAATRSMPPSRSLACPIHIDDELETGRLLDRQVGGLSALEESYRLHGSLAKKASIYREVVGREMGQAQQKRRAVLIVEDDAGLRELIAALLADSKLELDIIECETAEAALATVLIRGRDIGMVFADVQLPGSMNGVDLAWEVKMRWPLLPVILTSGHPLKLVDELPQGVAYISKPWQPLSLILAAHEALVPQRD
jgi:CheY-like chemotaxis protein